MISFKKRLLTPGPTIVPERVLKALSTPTVYHRSPEFKSTFLDAIERLKRLFKTQGELLILSSSGTGAMESAVSNLFNPGDDAVVVVGGKFGERWKELCEAYRVNPIVVEVEWGKAVNPEEVKKAILSSRKVRGVLVQICETSTGTIYDVKGIADVVKEFEDVILVADGITAIGVYDIPVDDWGIDVAITGSQKALMCPPGLAIISLGEKAVERVYKTENARYYFDLRKEIKSQSQGQTAYTSSVNLVFALNEALKIMEEEGFENVFKRHELLARCMREGIKSIGLELFSESPANGVTAVKVPEGVDGLELVRVARERYGATIAGGQEHLKGRIFRLSHMGYVDVFDILMELELAELVLSDLGYRDFEFGSSVKAALKVFKGS